MKAIAILAAAAALATLAGCERLGIGGGSANNSANAAAGNTAAGGKDGAGNTAAPAADAGKDPAAAAAAPAAAGGIVLDRTFMMGRWADAGEECGDAIEFTQDGRFVAGNGGTGLWNLEGDRLTMTGRDTATIRIVPIDQDTITVINADGSLGRSTRC
ncbi:MAG TPA: hypothetical protein VK614_15515 [Allosphingosinicella sp.]|nr:hypothetical protein [Allosphingosinicella sp.]